MLSITLECDRSEKERIAAELYEAGTEGILEEDLLENRCRLEAFFDETVDAAALSDRFIPYGAVVKQVEGQDWVEISQRQWAPVLVGKRLFLVPSWRNDPVPPGRLRVEMPSGLAYGTGLDPATQLALETLERALKPEARMLDLGTGSGILAVAAKALGAGTVFACDIDPHAADAARGLFEASGVEIYTYVGSVRSLRSDCVDLVVANINAVTIIGLAAEIARILRPGGTAILSGFTQGQAERIRDLLAGRRLPVRESLEKGGWICVIAGPKG